MGELKIEIAVNGFIVYESGGEIARGRTWAFESPKSLAIFIEEWGNGNQESKGVNNEQF